MVDILERSNGQFSWFILLNRDSIFFDEYQEIDPASLIFYTKDDCSLCEEVKVMLKPLAGHYSEVDIKHPNNDHLYGRFRYEIPVIEYRSKSSDGQVVLLRNKQITIEKLGPILDEILANKCIKCFKD